MTPLTPLERRLWLRTGLLGFAISLSALGILFSIRVVFQIQPSYLDMDTIPPALPLASDAEHPFIFIVTLLGVFPTLFLGGMVLYLTNQLIVPDSALIGKTAGNIGSTIVMVLGAVLLLWVYVLRVIPDSLETRILLRQLLISTYHFYHVFLLLSILVVTLTSFGMVPSYVSWTNIVCGLIGMAILLISINPNTPFTTSLIMLVMEGIIGTTTSAYMINRSLAVLPAEAATILEDDNSTILS